MQNLNIHCTIHKSEKIIQFCIKKQCQTLLCQQCISSHSQKHFLMKNLPQYITIQEMHENLQQSITKKINLLQKNQQKIDSILEQLNSSKIKINEQLQQTRNKCINLINFFFNQQKKISQVKLQSLKVEYKFQPLKFAIQADINKIKFEKQHLINLQFTEYYHKLKELLMAGLSTSQKKTDEQIMKNVELSLQINNINIVGKLEQIFKDQLFILKMKSNKKSAFKSIEKRAKSKSKKNKPTVNFSPSTCSDNDDKDKSVRWAWPVQKQIYNKQNQVILDKVREQISIYDPYRNHRNITANNLNAQYYPKTQQNNNINNGTPYNLRNPNHIDKNIQMLNTSSPNLKTLFNLINSDSKQHNAKSPINTNSSFDNNNNNSFNNNFNNYSARNNTTSSPQGNNYQNYYVPNTNYVNITYNQNIASNWT